MTTTFFDTYGRPVWQKDADGFLSYTGYDPATGAVVKAISDVDTTRTIQFDNPQRHGAWSIWQPLDVGRNHRVRFSQFTLRREGAAEVWIGNHVVRRPTN